MRRPSLRTALAAVAIASLVAAGCGDDDDDATGDGAATEANADAAGAGGGERVLVIDVRVLDVDHDLAGRERVEREILETRADLAVGLVNAECLERIHSRAPTRKVANILP